MSIQEIYILNELRLYKRIDPNQVCLESSPGIFGESSRAGDGCYGQGEGRGGPIYTSYATFCFREEGTLAVPSLFFVRPLGAPTMDLLLGPAQPYRP